MILYCQTLKDFTEWPLLLSLATRSYTISVEAGRSRQKRSPSIKVAIVHEHAEYTNCVSMLNALAYTLHSPYLSYISRFTKQ